MFNKILVVSSVDPIPAKTFNLTIQRFTDENIMSFVSFFFEITHDLVPIGLCQMSTPFATLGNVIALVTCHCPVCHLHVLGVRVVYDWNIDR